MRLTKKLENGEYAPNKNTGWSTFNKLGQLEDVEEELGIDLVELFSTQHKDSYDLKVEKEDKTIYFCGDSYYGHWNKKQWLGFIKDVIAVYKELLKLGH